MHVGKTAWAALLATQCALGAHAATCTTERINGERVLVPNCGDGSCAQYAVGDATYDLGFGGPEPDGISFEFYKTGGIPELGNFSLTTNVNDNYATCEQCILILQDFVAGEPTKTFFQSSGNLIVSGDAAPGVADQLTLIWSNLTLVEVTIDPNTFESTPVLGGACYDVLPEVVYADGFDA